MECEVLFCYKTAVSRVTVPKTAPNTAMCEKHTHEYLDRAKGYRQTIGMVQVAPAN